MPDKKPTYREINGTTRVGDFLRKLGKSDMLKSVLQAGSNYGIPFLDIVGDMITTSSELDEKEKAHALKLLEYDITEAKEISKRWSNDMLSDSFLSKNVRPLILLYSWGLITVMIFFKDEINTAYITLIEGLAITVNLAYFGGRSWIKHKKIKNGNV